MTLQAQIAKTIRRMHPSGVYEEPMVAAWDTHLPRARVQSLFHELAKVPFARVDLALPNSEMDRAHTLYVGHEPAPGWREFNRDSTDRERARSLSEAGGSIAFWIVEISRVGPYWHEFWNEMRFEGNRIVARVTEPADGSEWDVIRKGVCQVLDRFQLRRVDASLLEVPLPWMTTAAAHLLQERGRPPYPTVRHALFSDIY